MNMPEHLYVHVPFCSGTCTYCAFYSAPYTPDLADRYLEELENDLRNTLASDTPSTPTTIYIGGGTPSVLSPPQLQRLCTIVTTCTDASSVQEWTIEGNPGTFSADKIRILTNAGITRVSMGAQSFDPATLNRVGRRHSVEDIPDTVAQLRGLGIRNIGIDLISNLPGVTSAAWSKSLRSTVALAPDHVSVYALTIEPESVLGRAHARGNEITPADQEQIDALDEAHAILDQADYRQYEISNFCRPQRECLHNLAIWRGADYVGFGPAAASRVERRRWTNPPNLARYIDKGGADTSTPEVLTAQQDICERLIFRFRLNEGVDLHQFGRSYDGADDLLPIWTRTLHELATEQLVTKRDHTWTLTPQGRLAADHVAEALLI